MKSVIALIATAFAFTAFAADAPKKDEKQAAKPAASAAKPAASAKK